MKTKYEIVQIDQAEITVDVSIPLEMNVSFFNATDIATLYGKKVRDFLRVESIKEYLEILFVDPDSVILQYDDAVKVCRGKYGGTWLHNELAFEFVGWCSVSLRDKLHEYTE